FIPVLRFIFFELFVGASDEVIAALKLRFTNENSAIGVYGGAEFEFQNEIVRKFAGCPNGLDNSGLVRIHYENAVGRRVAAVIADGLSVKIVRFESPAGQVFAIEKADKAGFDFSFGGLSAHRGQRE